CLSAGGMDIMYGEQIRFRGVAIEMSRDSSDLGNECTPNGCSATVHEIERLLSRCEPSITSANSGNVHQVTCSSSSELGKCVPTCRRFRVPHTSFLSFEHPPRLSTLSLPRCV